MTAIPTHQVGDRVSTISGLPATVTQVTGVRVFRYAVELDGDQGTEHGGYHDGELTPLTKVVEA